MIMGQVLGMSNPMPICRKIADVLASRWLVHSIANYYDLNTWSITVGHPARREAYVGMKTGRPASPTGALPRPLWGMV